MIVKNSKLLAQYRTAGPCGICGKRSKKRVPHHVYKRQMGGGQRMDVPENLIALGGPFDCRCHDQADAYFVKRPTILEIQARKLGYPDWEAVEAFLIWLRNADKRTTPEEVEAKRSELRLKKAG